MAKQLVLNTRRPVSIKNLTILLVDISKTLTFARHVPIVDAWDILLRCVGPKGKFSNLQKIKLRKRVTYLEKESNTTSSDNTMDSSEDDDKADTVNDFREKKKEKKLGFSCEKRFG